MLSIYAPYVRDTAITFEYDVPDLAEFSCRLDGVTKKFPWLVAELKGSVAGYAYASAFHQRAAYGWCAELAIYLNKDIRGNGLGAILYTALEELLKKQNILLLYACIAETDCEDSRLTNASTRFHSRLGFREVGRFNKCGYKFGRWFDMVWMEKRLAEPAPHPIAVIPFTSLKKAEK